MNKGRAWKKWFRADASVDVNFGPFMYPEAFFIAFKSTISSARYAVSQIDKVLGINLKKNFDRTWESEPYGGFFDNVYWIFEVLGPPDEKPIRAKFAIWHNAIIPTPLYSATYIFPLGNYEWGLWTLLNVETLHYLSPDVTLSPYPLRLTIQAAGYDRYNP